MNDARIVEGLKALARATDGREPSASVEEALMAAFDARQSSGLHRREWAAWLGAAAAVVLVAGGMFLAQRDMDEGPTVGPTFRSGVSETSQMSDFIPWPGAAMLPAFESGELVRTELPASVLPLLGLPPADAPAGERVLADVLYAQDGLARAVRIVHDQSMTP